MRHDTQNHEKDGHGHYDDIVTDTAMQKNKHFYHDNFAFTHKDKCEKNVSIWLYQVMAISSQKKMCCLNCRPWWFIKMQVNHYPLKNSFLRVKRNEPIRHEENNNITKYEEAKYKKIRQKTNVKACEE